MADGSKVTYYYAWKGGPRILSQPRTPAFIKEYTTAHAKRAEPAKDTLKGLITSFKNSAEFAGLAVRSQQDYSTYLSVIDDAFGTMPLKAAEDPRARGIFKEWRDKFAKTPRKADHLWVSLSRLLSFGKDRGKLKVNVCEKGGRLYKAQRQEKIWTEDQLSSFLSVASKELQLALLMALWTGQRQGDLLSLKWTQLTEKGLRIRQGKGGTTLTIPVSLTLLDALNATEARSENILVNSDGNSWTADGFRSSWRKTCLKAGVEGVTFHDLRGTAVTRLAVAGCSVPEIAAITGHSLRDVQEILDSHYMGGQLQLAEQAMARLEVFQTKLQTKALETVG